MKYDKVVQTTSMRYGIREKIENGGINERGVCIKCMNLFYTNAALRKS